jgi:hypothetical protein
MRQGATGTWDGAPNFVTRAAFRHQSRRSRQRASVTRHVPGVHIMEIELADAVPVQLCGPLTTSLPSGPTVPVNPLNGAANEREQPVCVTVTLWPMSEESQWAVIIQAPAVSGHAPAAPLSPLAGDAVEEPELQPKTKSSGSSENQFRSIL